MHAAVREDHEWVLLRAVQIDRDENVSAHAQRVPRALRRGIRLVAAGRSGETHNIDFGHRSQSLEEH